MDERYDFQRAVTDGRFHYIRNYTPPRVFQHHAFEWQLKSYQSWEREWRGGHLWYVARPSLREIHFAQDRGKPWIRMQRAVWRKVSRPEDEGRKSVGTSARFCCEIIPRPPGHAATASEPHVVRQLSIG